MSVDFNGGTNRVVTSGNLTTGNLVSFGAWLYPLGMGGANSGTVFAHGVSGSIRAQLQFNGTAGSNKLHYKCQRATVNGTWEMTPGFPALNMWRWVGVTYDGGAVGNHPTLYTLDSESRVWSVLTNGAGLTRTSTPSGALSADAQAIRLGNISALSQQWNGFLAHLFSYNRILTDPEMRFIAYRGARRLPRSLLFSWPSARFVGGLVLDELGLLPGTPSGTGTAASAPEQHPPARW